ncbi:MAG: PhoU domain-containing protein [Desulfurococcaceae archaeon]
MSQLTPDIHRRFHLKPTIIKYKPDSVRNILDHIWKLTNISIDLAFYAYFSRDEELALKILDLDKRVAEHIGQFIMHNAMAYGRSKEGGYAGLLSFYYGSAMDTISDSVKDIVYTLLLGYTPRLNYNQVLTYAEGEVVAKLKADREFEVIELTDKYPVDVLLIVEKEKYKFSPDPRDRVKKNSLIYVRGFKEVVLRLLSDYGVEYKLEDVEAPGLERVLRNLIDIKDCTVLMLDLAHYVLMEFSRELMEEVEDLEIQIDWMHMETIKTLSSLTNKIDPDTFIGIVTVLKELEDIADASNTISRIPSLEEEFPEEYKILFSRVFESIDEKVKTITAGKPINLHNLDHYLRKYGGQVLAVKTKDSWIAYPFAREISLNPGDKLIIVYQEEFAEEVERLLASKT